MPKLPGDAASYMPPPEWLGSWLTLDTRRHLTLNDVQHTISEYTDVIAYVCYMCLHKEVGGTASSRIDIMRHSVHAHQYVTVVAELVFTHPKDEVGFIHPPRYQCTVCKMLFTRLLNVPSHTCALISNIDLQDFDKLTRMKSKKSSK